MQPVKDPSSRRALVVLLGTMLVVPAAAVVLAHELLPRLPAVAPPTAPPPAPREAKPVENLTPEVRGRILSAEGEPVAGAAVRLVSTSLPLALLRDTKSDGAGTFSFAHAPLGSARVEADHDPDGTVSSEAVDVAEGQTTDLTLVLSAAGAVRGTLVDGEDHPVAGGALSVEGLPWNVSGATSDDTGAFRLSTVPREATTLVAVARGYRVARAVLEPRLDRTDLVVRIRLEAAGPIDGDVLDADDKPVVAHIVACEGQSFEARADSGKDGTFQLPPSALGCTAVAEHDDFAPSDPTALVEGRRAVLRLKAGGTIEGEVVDDRGAGIPSFSVGVESFSAARGGNFRSVAGRSFEEPRGNFRLEKLPPGSYVLTATAPGKPPTRSVPVEVQGGASSRGVRIVIPEGGAVTGHVLDEGQEPIAGAEVTFDFVSSAVESGAKATTDERGQYRLDAAPAGSFTLRAYKAGYRTRLVSGLRVESHAVLKADVTLTAAADGGGGFELAGIGAGIMPTGKGITIRSVFAGDPAERAGLHEGDLVLSIDGESTSGMSGADAIQRLRGVIGTSVGVSVRRPSTGETLDVMIVRAAIVH